MNERFFLDTNILIYANDSSSPARRDRARALLAEAFHTRLGCLSTQVLQEFFVVATRKMAMQAHNARAQLLQLAALDTVQIDRDRIVAAVDLHLTHQLTFWDALVVKCASAAGCKVLYTEDLNHGQIIDGVRVDNPFR